VQMVLDRAILDRPLVNCHPLVNDRTTALTPSDLLRFLEATGHAPEWIDLDGT
jgi:Ala-tRNA(Pro) deacylase